MARKRKPKGLGDVVETALQATGIDKVAKFLLGEDCGCNERKQKLNELMPFRKPNCLEEHEYNYLTEWFNKNTKKILPSEQIEFIKIYNRVFRAKQGVTTCESCWRDIINDLRQVYETYSNL